jgi:hypothetical protein
MKIVLLFTSIVMSMNLFAIFGDKQDFTVKNHASAKGVAKDKYEIKTELGNLIVRQSVQVELNKRVDDKIAVGVHGGYYQSPTGFLANEKKSLNKKDFFAYRKAENKAYKIGLHVSYRSNGHDKTGLIVGLYPTYVRGSYLASTHWGVMRTASENHLQLPIKVGYQCFTVSSDVETGVHYGFKAGNIVGYKTFNILNIGVSV